jgi:RND family efflux transporter MFP subunit
VRDATVQGPTAAVRVDEVPLMREAVGTLAARVTAAVASKVMANVLEVTVDVGERVRNGTVLVRLDGRDLAARLREAEAGAGAARAAMRGAEADYQRFADLIKRHAVTQKEFDDVRTRYAMAQSQVQAAEQAVAQARVALGDVDIAAPLDGVVAEKMVHPGDLAVPGKPLLMLHDPQQLRIEAAIAEELAPGLPVGTAVTVRVDAVGKSFATRIDEIIPQADPLTHTIAIRAGLPAGAGLQPGMFGRVLFSTGAVRSLSIPQRAVRHIGQLESVQVVTPNGPRPRHVQTGLVRDDRVEILAGLEAGETVLLAPDEPHE